MNRRSAFITGATGFLGRHLVEELCGRGWQVTAFCLPGDSVDALPREAAVVRGDVTDLEALHSGIPDAVDVVFHVAANTSTWSRNAAEQHRVNVLGTGKVIEAALARHVRRLIYTSSISAYGYQPGVRFSEDTPSNVLSRGDNYGRTKYLAEQRVRQAASEAGLEAVILNPVNVLGPYDRANWTGQLILPIAQGRLRVVPPGLASWAYVADVAGAYRRS